MDGPDPIRDCIHGHLKRKCEVCYLEAELSAAEADLAKMREALETAHFALITIPGSPPFNDRLRKAALEVEAALKSEGEGGHDGR